MGRTRVAIARGVARAVAANGARRTTMIDIAAAAGIAKGTLYNHVRTKADAYQLCAEVEMDQLRDALASGTPAEGLAAAAEVVAAHPVLRALAEQEPGALAHLLLPGSRGADLRAALEADLAARLGPAAAPLALRWLLGVALVPGAPADRAAAVVLLAAPAGGGD